MQGQTTWPCPHQLRKCPCQSSIWWQGCSFEQLQNSFSLSFCNCSMSFQHLKHLASACSAGTLECHRRSQIAVETLLATGHSKGWNGTLHRDAMTLALSSLVLPRLGSDMLLMLSISICKTRRWDLRMVALLIFVIFPLAQPSSKSSLLGESNGFECTMRFHSLCHVCLRMDPHLIQRVRYGRHGDCLQVLELVLTVCLPHSGRLRGPYLTVVADDLRLVTISSGDRVLKWLMMELDVLSQFDRIAGQDGELANTPRGQLGYGSKFRWQRDCKIGRV